LDKKKKGFELKDQQININDEDDNDFLPPPPRIEKIENYNGDEKNENIKNGNETNIIPNPPLEINIKTEITDNTIKSENIVNIPPPPPIDNNYKDDKENELDPEMDDPELEPELEPQVESDDDLPPPPPENNVTGGAGEINEDQ